MATTANEHNVTLVKEVQLVAENEDDGRVNLGSGVYLTRWNNGDVLLCNFPTTANPEDYRDIITFEVHLDTQWKQQEVLMMLQA